MRSYQLDGLNWLIELHNAHVNGVLADEMGLGKTLQTISLLGYLKNVMNLRGPHIVIVPNSTLANWKKEFDRWCPSLNAFIFHGDKEKRGRLKAETLVAGAFEVCITSYEMVLREQSALGKFSWEYLIIDEAHRIKNEESKLSEAVRTFRTNHRLLLTGTPLQNNLHELWALLNFLMPDLFQTSATFDKWFKEGQGDGQSSAVSRLHKVLKPFLLRRVKVDVEKELLPKKEVKVFVGLTREQKDLYKKVLLKDFEAVNGVVGGKHGRMRLLNVAMQLRKVCNHPYLFDGVEEGPPFKEGEHLVEKCGKMVVLDKLLTKLKRNKSRVLIFSQMTRMLDILEDFLDLRGYDYCRIDGSTHQEERELEIEAFNAPQSKKFVFLLSTRAGGLGINLATADTVVLFDSDWNPQMDLQAMDRAHRIGQTKQVMVYRLVTGDTVEQKIVERAEAKLFLDALVIQQGRLVEKHENATGDELLGMIKFGADTIFQGGDDYQITDADIDEIIALGQKKGEEFSEKLQAANLNAANYSLGELITSNNLYEHEGQDFSALHRAKTRNQLLTWIAPPKRETKVSTYNEQAYFTKKLNPNAKSGPRKRSAPVRPPGQPVLQPFQFFPARLNDLFDIETAHFQAQQQCKALQERIEAIRKAKADAGEEALQKELGDLPQELAEAEAAIPEPLSEAQEAEKRKLLADGFLEWKRQDFQAFVRGMEIYGRGALQEIADEVGFDLAEVKRYHKVFWKRYTELEDHEKIEARLQRGDARREKQKHLIELLKTTFSPYKDPLREVSINDLVGGTSTLSTWTPEGDLWLLVNTYKLGYGSWERLRRRIQEEPDFRMDWWMLTRNAEDLQERVDRLLKSISERTRKKEAPAAATGATEAKPKKPASTSTSRGGGVKPVLAAASDAATTDTKKRAKREGPKKGRTSYQFFIKEKRAEMKSTHPQASTADVTKEIGKAWKDVDPETRKKYEALATADALRYREEKAAWDASHPEGGTGDQPAKGKKAKVSASASALSSKSEPPKKPTTGYFLFSKEKRASLDQTLKVTEQAKVLADKWKALSEADKKVYNDQAAKLKAQYTKDMAAWRKAHPKEAAALDKATKEKKAASKEKKRKKSGEGEQTSPGQQAAGAAKAAPKKQTSISAIVKPKAAAATRAAAPPAAKRAKATTTEQEQESDDIPLGKRVNKPEASKKKASKDEESDDIPLGQQIANKGKRAGKKEKDNHDDQGDQEVGKEEGVGPVKKAKVE